MSTDDALRYFIAAKVLADKHSTAYGIFQFLDSTWGGYGIPKTSDPTQHGVYGQPGHPDHKIAVERLVAAGVVRGKDTDTGCCGRCGGTGRDDTGPETGGWCWDCQGTGHPHVETAPCTGGTDSAGGEPQ